MFPTTAATSPRPRSPLHSGTTFVPRIGYGDEVRVLRRHVAREVLERPVAARTRAARDPLLELRLGRPLGTPPRLCRLEVAAPGDHSQTCDGPSAGTGCIPRPIGCVRSKNSSVSAISFYGPSLNDHRPSRRHAWSSRSRSLIAFLVGIGCRATRLDRDRPPPSRLNVHRCPFPESHRA